MAPALFSIRPSDVLAQRHPQSFRTYSGAPKRIHAHDFQLNDCAAIRCGSSGCKMHVRVHRIHPGNELANPCRRALRDLVRSHLVKTQLHPLPHSIAGRPVGTPNRLSLVQLTCCAALSESTASQASRKHQKKNGSGDFHRAMVEQGGAA